MPRFPREGNPFYSAARQFVERCLREGDSLFVPGRAIWATAPGADLYHPFVESPDTGIKAFASPRAKGRGSVPSLGSVLPWKQARHSPRVASLAASDARSSRSS